ncbi:hypothetical protein C8F04DRAFT_1158646 [Mycena alexandri]|uniref:Zn(2)-C6 fungal-type domain-containing protein n=1 Tax=Mycena alexandri TaxID=1745969 RepID=A0AAD6S153_9AGAR|nr:hypothetical protein C8F04DRAFT_1158646 [Mycena alexandri]
MSSNATGASKPPRKRPPKPRTEPLRRGKACLNCRHLKIRCDGARPVCGPCTRVPKDDECEFTDVNSRTKELQATINRLKARVKELEDPKTVSPAMVLTRPDSPGPIASGSSLWARRSPTSGSISEGSSLISSPDAESNHSFLGVQEPPFAMMQMLLDQFLPHASQFGFFMHPDRFHASALLQLPLGHPARPSPALLCAVYLWGIHLSRSEPLISYEAIFIRRAQQHISTELADSAHPVHRIHTMQAHILLSTYFLRNKQFLEAEFHTNGAVTLALGYHLHKIRSSRPSPPPLLGASSFTEVFLDPPRDNIEEGERIRGLWAVVYSQNNLLMTVRTANNFGMLESPGLQIDTPWPLDMTEYELGLLPHDLRGSDTVHNFVNRGVPGPNNFFALQVQASVLLQQAAQLARRWSLAMQPQVNAAYMNATAHLNTRIQQFSAGIPPLPEYYDRSEDGRTLAITHALLGAAVIQLHKNGTETSAICINAARGIVTALGDSNVPNFVCAGPVVGALLLLACQVVIREIERMRQFCAGLRSTLNVDVACRGEETALLLDLQNGLTTMSIYATDSPLVQYQLTKIQQKCDTLSL